jgi:hypothetical protein
VLCRPNFRTHICIQTFRIRQSYIGRQQDGNDLGAEDIVFQGYAFLRRQRTRIDDGRPGATALPAYA